MKQAVLYLIILFFARCSSHQHGTDALFSGRLKLYFPDTVYLQSEKKDLGTFDFNSDELSDFNTEYKISDSFKIVNRSIKILLLSSLSSGHTVTSYANDTLLPFSFMWVKFRSSVSGIHNKGNHERNITILAEDLKGKKTKLTYGFSFKVIPQRSLNGKWVVLVYKTSEKEKSPYHQVMEVKWHEETKNTGWIDVNTFDGYGAQYVKMENGRINFFSMPMAVRSACCPTEDDVKVSLLFEKVETMKQDGDTLILSGKGAYIKMVRGEVYYNR